MLSVENLSYTYPGGTEAVRGIDFSIEEGEIFGFLGPSGAGKSTTQKVLIRLLRGFQGSITVLGKPLNEWDDSYYEQVGVAFELPNHYQKLTARENLSLFRTLYSRETRDPAALLEMVGLEDDADTRISQFSKGMQMRLNFVRALIHMPDLLFLDEPTTGLDPVNGQKIKDILRQQKAEGRTIFLTTHDMTVADQICDRVAFIVDGEITLIDSPRNLRLQHGRRRVRVEYHHDGPAAPPQQAGFPLDGLGDSDEFLKILRSNRIETIHTQEATLEDIFIQTTGRSLT
ncbi:MAG: ABC transporter ATP-binding protein [Caldilineaceae bacterium SB0665_bin_25]|nr:ABC transporter ATP-binding protein [Caldilineaceae bacterium SB0665_bin_25]